MPIQPDIYALLWDNGLGQPDQYRLFVGATSSLLHATALAVSYLNTVDKYYDTSYVMIYRTQAGTINTDSLIGLIHYADLMNVEDWFHVG